MEERDEEGRVIARHQVFALDGSVFTDISFQDCVMTYCGMLEVRFHNCKFHNIEFRFDGPAARALDFVRALAVADPQSHAMVEKFFENVLKGRTTTHDEEEAQHFSVGGPRTLQ